MALSSSANDDPTPADRGPATQPPASSRHPATGQPSVWLVLGDKPGDNGQVEVIAQALGWACDRKHLAMRDPFVHRKPRMRATLGHIDLDRSDALEPPWPDLIVTVGRRPSMAALWIRKQSRGRTRIVLVGKPSGRVEWYDLIVASREIVLPPLPNVATIVLPLMQIDDEAIADAAAQWGPRLGRLPRPLIGFLIGGPTSPFAYTEAMVAQLLEAAQDVAREKGGTPYITTSRRTPDWVVAALESGLPPGGRLFVWDAAAQDNPYRGLLALADGLVVTGDSISMMVEAIKVGRPVAVFPVPTGPLGSLDQLRRTAVRRLFGDDGRGEEGEARRKAGRLLYRLRLANHTRDFRAFHQHLFDLGLAVPAGRELVRAPAPLPDDVSVAVARIKDLAGSG